MQSYVAQQSVQVRNVLRSNGVETEYLVFKDEGHDVTRFENKVICYTKIINFLSKHLTVQPRARSPTSE